MSVQEYICGDYDGSEGSVYLDDGEDCNGNVVKIKVHLCKACAIMRLQAMLDDLSRRSQREYFKDILEVA